MDFKACLLLLTGVFVVCVVTGVPAPKALWDFAEMIRCVQPDVSPLRYNNYGCWCGRGGSGTPVDDLDKCCEGHDKCYQSSRKAPGCTSPLKNPYILDYDFSCQNHQVTCSGSNDKCEAAVCRCDQTAVNCFANNTYNPQNKDLDRDVHCVP
ncbi:phospholipase A2 isoform X1 [Oryzias melastigma]|uniref:phospholipase A2 isoform X1 n=1 Tax=Oryzias melastigma TaxID=30732 RepID=UPI000CF7B4B3|nr:phospholipase A2 isoform X1 [Oryzias melastigma]XP_024131548.1 phospholipase A2 isoform X1 [Oryzias melastigma]